MVLGDELDESDSAALAGDAVFEDVGDFVEGGEESVEVGVGEGVV